MTRVTLLRRIVAVFVAVCCAASINAVAKDYPADSGWSTFWGAFVDEIAGPPGAEALKPREHFSEAGIAFDYPAVLRVHYDAEDRQWRLWRGDFEFEVHVGSYREGHAQRLLEMMGGMLHDGETAAPPPESIPALSLCGRDVPGWRLRLTFLDEPHEYLAYTLSLGDNDARLFLFDDLLVDGKTSLLHEATLEALRTSLRCTAG
ncbi:MAG: hypothetical protein JNN30_18420 [Rhodanobacteraceae bacterium]|nr:hypothetical protein [Rhodanobacteraceae bacterium]